MRRSKEAALTHPTEDDILLAQLMCSRLCHDLVSPSGAVNTGLELLDEAGALTGQDQDALALVRTSAQELSNRLAFFRMAFGFGGGPSNPVALSELVRLADRALTGPKLSIRWEGADVPGQGTSGASGKLLLLCLLVAAEALIRGGELAVQFAPVDGRLGIAISAVGPDVRLRPEIAAALAGSPGADDLSARTIHAHVARRLADAAQIPLEIEAPDGDRLQLALLLQSGD